MKYDSYIYIDVNIDEQLLKRVLQLAGDSVPVKKEKYYFIRAPLSSTKEFREIIELLENGNVRYDIYSILRHFNKAENEGAFFFEPYVPSISIDVYRDSSCKEVIRSMPRYGRSGLATPTVQIRQVGDRLAVSCDVWSSIRYEQKGLIGPSDNQEGGL